MADKLVEMAKWYGFDSNYFINAEEALPSSFLPVYETLPCHDLPGHLCSGFYASNASMVKQ